MQHQSQTDGLTGLKNRHALREDFMHITSGEVTMMMMDVRSFKSFNDQFGHDLGDQVLVACAGQLQAFFGDCDCYRYGGDEFLVVSTSLPPMVMETRARQLEDALSQCMWGRRCRPFIWTGGF